MFRSAKRPSIRLKTALSTVAALPLFLTGCAQSVVSIPEQSPLAAKLLKETPANAYADSSIRPIQQPQTLDRERVMLGKDLFHDPRLSRDNSIACATCHIIGDGGDDNRERAFGIDGHVSALNSPTVLNASLQFAQFWDGRAATLEEQVHGPIHNATEMDSDWIDVLEKLNADQALVERFNNEYEEGLTSDTVVDAIVTYEHALITPNAPFDRYLLGDDDAIDAEAREGYQLFQSYGCIACHQGVNLGGNLYQRLGIMEDYFVEGMELDESDYGRYNVTGREQDKFRFKVPSLRNVALTAPYFHDGSIPSLAGVVRMMAKYQLGRSIPEEDVDKIVHFLETLTGELDESLT